MLDFILGLLSNDEDKNDDVLSDFGLDKNEIDAVKKDDYDCWNFDEEDLEEDDYYYEDDETSLYNDDDEDDDDDV